MHEEYKVNDLIMVKACNVSNAVGNLMSKFLALYEGPYKITRQQGPATFEVSNTGSGQVREVFHVSNLKPFFSNGTKTPAKAREATTPKADRGDKCLINQLESEMKECQQRKEGRMKLLFKGCTSKHGIVVKVWDTTERFEKNSMVDEWRVKCWPSLAPTKPPILTEPAELEAARQAFLERNSGTRWRRRELRSPTTSEEDLLSLTEEVSLN